MRGLTAESPLRKEGTFRIFPSAFEIPQSVLEFSAAEAVFFFAIQKSSEPARRTRQANFGSPARLSSGGLTREVKLQAGGRVQQGAELTRSTFEGEF